MERLTISDEKIEGGMKRTCVDSRAGAGSERAEYGEET